MDKRGGAWNWTLPLNVIMVEITFGGSNAPIYHGAGIGNQTLSDLVASIEFVNPLGQVQTVKDPGQLAAAAGCFGLLGIPIPATRTDPAAPDWSICQRASQNAPEVLKVCPSGLLCNQYNPEIRRQIRDTDSRYRCSEKIAV